MSKPPKSPIEAHRSWRHQRISTSSLLPVGRSRAMAAPVATLNKE
jgi:hypothetical protein